MGRFVGRASVLVFEYDRDGVVFFPFVGRGLSGLVVVMVFDICDHLGAFYVVGRAFVYSFCVVVCVVDGGADCVYFRGEFGPRRLDGVRGVLVDVPPCGVGRYIVGYLAVAASEFLVVSAFFDACACVGDACVPVGNVSCVADAVLVVFGREGWACDARACVGVARVDESCGSVDVESAVGVWQAVADVVWRVGPVVARAHALCPPWRAVVLVAAVAGVCDGGACGVFEGVSVARGAIPAVVAGGA